MRATTLREDVGIEVNPIIERGQLSYFWQFELLLELNQSSVLFVGLEETFGDQFTAVTDSGQHAFQLNNNRLTKCFSCPWKRWLQRTSYSRFPLKTYLQLREPATCSGVTNGSSTHKPSRSVATQ